jgi:hypothetical protein
MYKSDRISEKVLFRFINIYGKYFNELFVTFEFRLMTIAGITEATEYVISLIESMIQVDEIRHYVKNLKRKPSVDNIADETVKKIAIDPTGKKIAVDHTGKKIIVLD